MSSTLLRKKPPGQDKQDCDEANQCNEQRHAGLFQPPGASSRRTDHNFSTTIQRSESSPLRLMKVNETTEKIRSRDYQRDRSETQPPNGGVHRCRVTWGR